MFLISKEVHMYNKKANEIISSHFQLTPLLINVLLFYTDLTIPAPTTAWLLFFIKTKRPSAG